MSFFNAGKEEVGINGEVEEEEEGEKFIRFAARDRRGETHSYSNIVHSGDVSCY